MSKIPSRQTLAGIGGNPLYVPMDGEGNASISGNLQVDGNVTIDNRIVAGSAIIATDAEVVGDLVVGNNSLITKNLIVNENLTVFKNLVVGNTAISNSVVTTGSNITCNDPGFFIGNGQGLTNLPPSNIGLVPSFFFNSQLVDFGVVFPNRFEPALEVPTPSLTIPCELYGKPSGLYFWKTDANIAIQSLWNSASGFVFWNGASVSGETTYSLTQYSSAFNPLYSLTYSYLDTTSLTKFNVTMESTNTSINPGQYNAYFVNFYKISDLGGSAQPLPTPTGLAVSAITSTDATVSWTQVLTYNYVVYLTNLDTSTITAYSVGEVGTITFSALSPPVVLTAGTNYSVQIQASYFSGSESQVSAKTAPVTFVTDAVGPVPTPTGLAVNATFLLADWDNNSPLENIFTLTNLTTPGITTSPIIADTPPLTLVSYFSFNPGDNYDLTIAAYDGGIYSIPSAPVNFTPP